MYGEDGNELELDGDRGNDLLYGGPGNDGGAPTSDNLRYRGLPARVTQTRCMVRTAPTP